MTPATVKLVENVIVLEVDNIMQDWPAYVINFTAENTGPQNASKSIRIDSDDEDEATVSEYRALTEDHDARILVTAVQRDETLRYESLDGTSDDGEEAAASDEESHDENLPATTHAVPVFLHGTPKEPAPLKRKTFDENWPPRRPRAFRKISPNSSIAMYDSFMTFPAAVRPVLEEIERDITRTA
ncbi:hypothetical protein PISMIDRAFT_14806 [Pisolithus microcarpus 441]|uniref:Uncharacterized protein n=1 Tax=Pisolithus microcarpus 441 TaxID=765257 RepID=A0A0C9YM62_9AGAM|nr:hypothetical protein PISMIDRAFT_14806 [Pisolithus microcarpus 441]